MLRNALVTWTLLGSVLMACTGNAPAGGTSTAGNQLFVQGVLFPTPVAEGAVCVFTSDPTQVMLSSGVLDLGFRSAYTATLLIGNQALGSTDASDSPSNGVELQGATVRVDNEAGAQIDSFHTLSSGFVYPPTGSVPGYEPMAVQLLDETATAGLQGQVSVEDTKRLVAHVTVQGTTRGGVVVQSDEFVFPVDVCNGCLVTFTAADMNPALPEPNCANSSSLGPSALPVPCILGQDTPVDCVDCQTLPICRGAAGASDGG